MKRTTLKRVIILAAIAAMLLATPASAKYTDQGSVVWSTTLDSEAACDCEPFEFPAAQAPLAGATPLVEKPTGELYDGKAVYMARFAGTTPGENVPSGLDVNVTAFNGSSNYIQMDAPLRKIPSTIQIRAFIDSAGAGARHYIFTCNASTGKPCISVELSAANVLMYYENYMGTSYVTANGGDISGYFDQWIWISVVRDIPANLIRFYINGTLIATGTCTSGMPASVWEEALPPRIGRDYRNFYPFLGSIREVRVWDAIKTGSEIAASVAMVTYDDLSSLDAAPLMSLWRLDYSGLKSGVFKNVIPGGPDGTPVGFDPTGVYQNVVLAPIAQFPETYKIIDSGGWWTYSTDGVQRKAALNASAGDTGFAQGLDSSTTFSGMFADDRGLIFASKYASYDRYRDAGPFDVWVKYVKP